MAILADVETDKPYFGVRQRNHTMRLVAEIAIGMQQEYLRQLLKPFDHMKYSPSLLHRGGNYGLHLTEIFMIYKTYKRNVT